MPQTIPLEASETLAFTPPSLSAIHGAPVFHLRATTRRDKRFHRRLNIENGVTQHDKFAFRQVVKHELAKSWTAEQCAEYVPVLEAYWQALDDHADLRKVEPDAVFEYDQEVADRCDRLVAMVADSSDEYRRMQADNVEGSELFQLATIAITVENYTGLVTPIQRERGYLTIDCIDELRDELRAFAARHLPEEEHGLPFIELNVACMKRMYLGEDEEKNSASPSPSGMLPESSTAESDHGSSPELASSPITPATA